MLILLVIVLNTLQIHAWTLAVFVDQNYQGSAKTFSSSNNECKDLSSALSRQVSSFQWDRAWLEDCCVHFKALDREIGFSCDDWKKPNMNSDNQMTSFCVTNC
ncbi:36431_t:CDS:1 [Gigaspora margarita]|uniref:36431_t:CDS:1 n=1 Tax=Gigaspora margarita TaxID=4874 RepID=A0ABN7US72_GIGMA|nr:36431_t:CDS:1 [Gigaspora margarita]